MNKTLRRLADPGKLPFLFLVLFAAAALYPQHFLQIYRIDTGPATNTVIDFITKQNFHLRIIKYNAAKQEVPGSFRKRHNVWHTAMMQRYP